MAIFKSIFLRGTRKTMGGATFRNVNGQTVGQALRASGTFTPSPETLFSQLAAPLLWQLFRRAAEVIRLGYTSKLRKQPAGSIFFKDNYQYMGTGTGSPVISTDDLLWTKGTMTTTPFTAVADQSANTVTVTFSATPADSSQLATDIPMVVITNVDGAPIPGIQPSAYPPFDSAVADVQTRADGSWAVQLPGGRFVAGDNINVWLSFSGAASTATAGKSSNSVLVTVVAVA